jgi:hypothetical protein
MKSNFRHEARQALERARVELGTGDDARLKCVALELRMAMEALTYDRAQAFAAELPPTEYDTWQPKKLLQLLLEINPLADKDSMLSFGVEEEYGVPTPVMQPLGSEKVLNLATLKRHYDALGNHLHMPTIKQIAAGKGPDAIKLRKRCEEIVDSSPQCSRLRSSTRPSAASRRCRAGRVARPSASGYRTARQACRRAASSARPATR